MALCKSDPKLVFEKLNKNPRLPEYARVEKRPIPHLPAASPYAGSNVPKVVYVSTKTPFMSAVKRVQKLLKEAEKRATAKIDLSDKNEKHKLEQLKKGTEALHKEEIFIKATGRAVDKAVNVGKWFDAKEEYSTRVETGSVMVVDDIVEDEELKEQLRQKTEPKTPSADDQASECATQANSRSDGKTDGSSSVRSTKKRKKRARVGDDTELPESRTRWVKMVEIAVIMN